MANPVGIIGSGHFGMALCNILAQNQDVLLFVRRESVKAEIESTRKYKQIAIPENVAVTTVLQELPRSCHLIFPVIPASFFREVIRDIATELKPWHILIHGTKGVEVEADMPKSGHSELVTPPLHKDQVWTMSQLIQKETPVVKVGCLAGPNLAKEIILGFPSAAVVASKFDEVIEEGGQALKSSKFRVHGSHELLGIELAGVLKNVIAIASGMIEGLKWGHNTRALLLTHGLAEMITIGKIFGVDPKAFLGLAGIGDLFATSSSSFSRNFTVGKRLAQGETLEAISEDMEETAEGVHTIPIVKALAQTYKISVPITQTLFKVIFEGKNLHNGIQLLMDLPLAKDVAFI